MTDGMVSSASLVLFLYCIGTKNVPRAMTSTATGAKKRAGITWFPELSDKSEGQCNTIVSYDVHGIIGKSTKTHLYYSMKNCNKSPNNFRDSIANNVDYYQVRYFVLLVC